MQAFKLLKSTKVFGGGKKEGRGGRLAHDLDARMQNIVLQHERIHIGRGAVIELPV